MAGRILRASSAGLLVVCWSGCAARSAGVDSTRAARVREPARAIQLNEQALALVESGRLAEAETMLREATSADPFFGPAHCNLGLVLLEQKRLYDAAWELQFACTLMPKASQPRANLGILYETAGRYEQADEQLRNALRLNPDDIDVIGHLARVHVRQGRHSTELQGWLETLALRDDDPAWNGWAREQLTQLDSHRTASEGEAP